MVQLSIINPQNILPTFANLKLAMFYFKLFWIFFSMGLFQKILGPKYRLLLAFSVWRKREWSKFQNGKRRHRKTAQRHQIKLNTLCNVHAAWNQRRTTVLNVINPQKPKSYFIFFLLAAEPVVGSGLNIEPVRTHVPSVANNISKTWASYNRSGSRATQCASPFAHRFGSIKTCAKV